jgi:hypothetical protein
LELSKKSWLLAIQFPDQEQPSLCSIEGGDAERLMLKLTAARDRWAKVSDALPIVTLCYEVRYDALWLVVAKLCARHIGRPIAVVFPRQWCRLRIPLIEGTGDRYSRLNGAQTRTVTPPS